MIAVLGVVGGSDGWCWGALGFQGRAGAVVKKEKLGGAAVVAGLGYVAPPVFYVSFSCFYWSLPRHQAPIPNVH